MNHDVLLEEALAHFLTVFPNQHPPRDLYAYVHGLLCSDYNVEVVEEFLEARLDALRDSLVTEYNHRTEDGASIRFLFLDDEADIIQGSNGAPHADRVAFQDGVNSLTSKEFEAFSAHILRLASCNRTWKTQETHDEGLDAFGYMPYFKIKSNWIGSPEVVFLAQAKHYSESRVGSKDIREFIGSSRLALHKVYSKLDERYNDLEIKPFAPIAMLFVTTQEVPRTVKNMARSAGLVVLTSDDLFLLFCSTEATLELPLRADWVATRIRHLIANIPNAK